MNDETAPSRIRISYNLLVEETPRTNPHSQVARNMASKLLTGLLLFVGLTCIRQPAQVRGQDGGQMPVARDASSAPTDGKKTQSPDTNSRANPVIIPFRLTTQNIISVPAIVDGRIALNLMFHTAVDSVSLTKATTSQFPELNFNQTVESSTWGGRSSVRSGKTTIAIGSLPRQEVVIFEDQNSGAETNGKFGPEQLGSAVIEINYTESKIRLWSEVPNSVQKDQSGWQRIPLSRESGMMLLSADVVANQQTASNKFLIHSGYNGFALLDNNFVSKNGFLNDLPVEKESQLSDAAGNKITTKQIQLPQINVGNTTLKSVPASFFDGSIGSQRYSVLGADFLARFNWVFDLDSNHAYLQQVAKPKATPS